MNEQPSLNDWLADDTNQASSDEQAFTLDVPAMTQRVERKLRQRRARRIASGAAGGVAIAMTVVVVFVMVNWPMQGPPSPAHDHAAGMTAAEVEAMRQAYFESKKTSDQLTRQLVQTTRDSNPGALTLDDRIHQTTRIIFERAKQKWSNGQLRDSALDDLYRLVEQFPDSPVVPEARRQIRILQSGDKNRRGQRDRVLLLALSRI